MMCRLCLEDNINDGVTCEDFPEISEIVKSTLDIDMNEENEYPRTICATCYEIIMEYYSFRTRCIENQKTLKIRLIKQKVAEMRRKTIEDDNEVIFVGIIKPEKEQEPVVQSQESDEEIRGFTGKTYGEDVSKKRKLTEVAEMEENCKVRRTESQMERYGIIPCSVAVKRLTAEAIERIIKLYQWKRNHSNDHNYIRIQAPSVDPPRNKSVIQVVRTYCSGTKSISSQNTSPAARNDTGESSKSRIEQPNSASPRLKVLSSAEINSRAQQHHRLSCTLINNRGKLDFNFTDEKNNEINFWSMTERQKKDILSTFEPEEVLQKLRKYFKVTPITRDMEAKLLSLYQGTIPFSVIVED
ncbi:uncharacterized protein LOC129803794 [Phlebotomus papatasi]|uniref:uncharacterized protein LOC129803794 n=1 Tax=Phlebotomus papatasi TaxID=29031 RepID=UPI002483363C|nr:uncharacterized protein LOC129803794 [Phlebotomus papatasi]